MGTCLCTKQVAEAYFGDGTRMTVFQPTTLRG
jgi:hypothetical protein